MNFATHDYRGTPCCVVMQYANEPRAILRLEGHRKPFEVRDADFYAVRPRLLIRAERA